MTNTKISWGMLRERPFGGLTVGQRAFKPEAMSAYMSSKDGQVHGLMGCECPGYVWTVTARDSASITLAHEDGEHTQVVRLNPKAKVLTVLAPVELAMLKTAREVCDRSGYWWDVVRVNRTTVTARRGEIVQRIPHGDVFEVR